MGLNKAEDFAFNLCRYSFLSLWSYANHRGRGGKELRDILVVCEPDVLIVSVKEVAVSNGDDGAANCERWRRRAVGASCRQIYRAERWLNSASHVTRSDGSQGLPLPLASDRRIHRVAVTLGGDGEAPLRWGNFGKGFVHVFDEVSLQIVMRELDTIGDFVAYLQAKENIRTKVVSNGAGEEDLLALYLHRGRQFPANYDRIVIDRGLLGKLVVKPEFVARRKADAQSYVFDNVIEEMVEAIVQGSLEYGPSLSESEIVFRVMQGRTVSRAASWANLLTNSWL